MWAKALELADWTLLLTGVPANRLTLSEALVLLRERWHSELLFTFWKQRGHRDARHTSAPWRILCDISATLIGLLLHHWLFVLLAWQDPQKSFGKLAGVVRQTASFLLEALAGHCSFLWAFQAIERSMRSGTQMNTRTKHPNSSQLLKDGFNWSIDPSAGAYGDCLSIPLVSQNFITGPGTPYPPRASSGQHLL
jgi:hypothetical protein